MRVFLNRLGIFLLLVSGALFALFFISDIIQAPNLGYFFWAIIFLAAGVLSLRVSRPDPKESQQFRLYRKLSSRKKKEEEE